MLHRPCNVVLVLTEEYIKIRCSILLYWTIRCTKEDALPVATKLKWLAHLPFLHIFLIPSYISEITIDICLTVNLICIYF